MKATEKIPWQKAIENMVEHAVDTAMVRMRIDGMEGINRRLYLHYKPCRRDRMGSLKLVDGDLIPPPDYLIAWPEPVRILRNAETDLRNFAKKHLSQLPLLAEDLVL